MTRTKRPSEAVETDESQLAGAIGNLTEEIRVLREAIDEWRLIIRWGLQNNKFKTDGDPVVQPRP